ncbi:MAG: serine/threonine protein kinase [Planctomycetes bacterium]|nr:serine/threonine protein kinase [Planctomycetota bacterium]
MADDRQSEDVADALADVNGRRRRGEPVDPVGYRDRLGASHAEFLSLLEVDAMLDQAVDPPPPERLPRGFGPYELLRELGRGAMGVVYEALHKTMRRKAAVKVLKSGFDADPQARDRFRREAFALAQVHHPHVVEVFEAGEVEGRPYYAMALVEGRSLASLIRAHDVPPVRDLCRELAGVADALHALHGAGIVHRDVKPSNLMVRSSDGRVLLSDFGLAHASDGLALTRSGDSIGTPLYMPPEQMKGKRDELDARSDVYSLGATLYEAIAGRPAFGATEYAALVREVIEKTPLPLRRVVPECPAAVSAIAMRALSKNRDDRHATAAQLRDDLRHVADGEDSQVTPPVSVLVHLRRWAAERWIPVAATVLALAGASWWWTHREATLVLDSLPSGAEVAVDGATRGTTPLSIGIRPGSHQITLRTDGFLDHVETRDLVAGGMHELRVPLALRDPSDPVPRQRLLASVGIRGGYEFARNRAAGGPSLLMVVPRGDVRREDLDTYAFEVGDRVDFPEGGTLEFRRGETVLHREPFDPPTMQVRAPLPEAVLSALRVGDEVTWGWFAPANARGAKDVTASFRLVLARTTADLLRLRQDLPAGAPSDLIGELEVRLLRERGLATAALARADALADAHPDLLPLQVVARQCYEALKLTGAERAQRLEQRIAAFPAESLARLKVASAAAGPVPSPTPGR